MSEDGALLNRLRCGDPEALRRIYESYKDSLLLIASCLLKDRGAAEDCLQDVFVAFVGKPDGIRVNGSLRAYLATSIANRARDRLRQRVRRPIAVLDMPDRASAEPGPAEQLAEGETSAQVREAIAGLPYDQREAIILRLHGEMTFKQIARVQAVSVNTAKGRYR